MPAPTAVPLSATQSADTSHLSDDSGDTARPQPTETGLRGGINEEFPRTPTEEDFKDVLTPGADFADVEGSGFSGDVSPSNDSLGGTR